MSCFRSVITLCLIIGVNFGAFAQDLFKKREYASLFDPTKIYTKVDFSDQMMLDMLAYDFSPAEIEFLKTRSSFSSWPVAINSEAKLKAAGAKLEEFEVFYVGECYYQGHSYGLLLVPAANNGHLEKDFKSKNDFVFIVGIDGYGVLVDVEIEEAPIMEVAPNTPRGEEMATAPPVVEPQMSQAPVTNRSQEISDALEGSAVRIKDPKKLYANFMLCSYPNARPLLDRTFRADYLAACDHAVEKAWPPALRSIEKRSQDPNVFDNYELIYLGAFDEYVLVTAIAETTQKLPEAYRTTTDLIFVFAKEAIDFDVNVIALPEMQVPLQTNDLFENALNIIVKDYVNKFGKIQGSQLPSIARVAESGVREYSCNVLLDGGFGKIVVAPDFTIFERNFVTLNNYNEALRKFEEYEARISMTQFPFVALESNPLMVEDKNRQKLWSVYPDINNDAYNELVISLNLIESEVMENEIANKFYTVSLVILGKK